MARKMGWNEEMKEKWGKKGEYRPERGIGDGEDRNEQNHQQSLL